MYLSNSEYVCSCDDVTVQYFLFKIDIRNYFKRNVEKADSDNEIESEPAQKVIKKENEGENFENIAQNDAGQFVSSSKNVTDKVRTDLLQNPFVPPEDYDFSNDALDKRRVFKRSWLQQYSPWMVYSALLKGVICIFVYFFLNRFDVDFKVRLLPERTPSLKMYTKMPSHTRVLSGTKVQLWLLQTF